MGAATGLALLFIGLRRRRGANLTREALPQGEGVGEISEFWRLFFRADMPCTMLDAHRTAERRSLEYHRGVALKLHERPALLDAVRARLDAMSQESTAEYVRSWRERLALPLLELTAFLVEDSQEARDCRQASPFAGMLSPRERWDIWRKVR
jgi:hypothetical protein